jgi:hypothetical protein
MSVSLDKWFHKELPKRSNYFYMDWTNPYKPAQWLIDKPATTFFERAIKFGELKTETVLCGVLPIRESAPETDNKYSSVGLLKSHLQKCIRRQMSELAVKTAYTLMRLEPVALLHRLSVIILEDVYLHESYSTVVWLLMAQQSNELSIGDYPVIITFLLCVVDYFANFKYFDNLEPPENSRFSFRQCLAKIEKEIADPIDRGLLYSIQLRKSHLVDDAGLSESSDSELLENKTHVWFLRFTTGQERYIKLVHQPLSVREYVVPAPLRLREWLLEGVDYHCAPIMIEWIQQKFPELSRKEIREAMWHKRSSINTRTYLGPKPVISAEINAIWRKISWHVEKNAIYILKNNH